jgi:NAD-dependent SIR2 family protein deacetylase
MLGSEDTVECDACGAVVDAETARRTETFGALNPAKWQTLCCPTCEARLKTVFVGREPSDR